MTTYTVINLHGDIDHEGASLAEAAQTVLTYDDHEYEFRREPDGWMQLYVSRFSRASTSGGRPLVRAADMFSFVDDDDAAEAEIFAKVIDHADRWNGLSVMTDEDYSADQAEIARQNAA